MNRLTGVAALVLVARLALAKEPDAAHRIEVAQGAQREITTTAKVRKVITNFGILTVEALGGNAILLRGRSEGQTTLLVWLEGGKRDEYLVTVGKPKTSSQSPKAEPKEPATDSNYMIELRLRESRRIHVEGRIHHVVTGNNDEAILKARVVGEHDIEIVGVGEGMTALLVWTVGEETPLLVHDNYLVRVQQAAPLAK